MQAERFFFLLGDCTVYCTNQPLLPSCSPCQQSHLNLDVHLVQDLTSKSVGFAVYLNIFQANQWLCCILNGLMPPSPHSWVEIQCPPVKILGSGGSLGDESVVRVAMRPPVLCSCYHVGGVDGAPGFGCTQPCLL